jgi:hypothetical protein
MRDRPIDRPIDTRSELPTKRVDAQKSKHQICDAYFGVPWVPLIRAAFVAAPQNTRSSLKKTALADILDLSHTQTVCKNHSHLRRRSRSCDIFAG